MNNMLECPNCGGYNVRIYSELEFEDEWCRCLDCGAEWRYKALLRELDAWREMDNRILFGLNNPAELDHVRGFILDNMHRVIGAIQAIQKQRRA
jgi:hypothetical protein